MTEKELKTRIEEYKSLKAEDKNRYREQLEFREKSITRDLVDVKSELYEIRMLDGRTDNASKFLLVMDGESKAKLEEVANMMNVSQSEYLRSAAFPHLEEDYNRLFLT